MYAVSLVEKQKLRVAKTTKLHINATQKKARAIRTVGFFVFNKYVKLKLLQVGILTSSKY